MTADTRGKNKKTRVLVLSGPSGSGKSTIVDRLIAHAPVPLTKVISATTRPSRPDEFDGEDYYFLSREEFERRRDAGDFLEWAEVHRSGHLYGTLKSEIQRAHEALSWAFLEIDVQGALNVMKEYPEAVTIFLKTPSDEEFERRLRDRGTESDDVIRNRLKTAREELKLAERYRYKITNDDLDRAVAEISDILSTLEAELHA